MPVPLDLVFSVFLSPIKKTNFVRECQKTDILKAKLYFHSPAVIAI